MHGSRWILIVSFLLAAVGFLLPLWPLSVLGIALAALSGHWLFALTLGLLIDIGFGAPRGSLHYFVLPFTLSAAVFGLARYWGTAFMRRSPGEKL